MDIFYQNFEELPKMKPELKMEKRRNSEPETSCTSFPETESAKPNQTNKSAKNSNSHPVYRGVRMRGRGKWESEIRQPHSTSRIWLGTFPTPEMAARAHDVVAQSIKEASTFLNYPELAGFLPRPKSLMPRDIQAAAAKAEVIEILTFDGSEEEDDIFSGLPSFGSFNDSQNKFTLADSWESMAIPDFGVDCSDQIMSEESLISSTFYGALWD